MTYKVTELSYCPRRFENQDGVAIGADILEQDTPRVTTDVRELAHKMGIKILGNHLNWPLLGRQFGKPLPSREEILRMGKSIDVFNRVHVTHTKNEIVQKLRHFVWVSSKLRYRIALMKLKSWVRLHDRYVTRTYGFVYRTAIEVAPMLDRGVEGVQIVEVRNFRMKMIPVFIVTSRYTLDASGDKTAHLAWFSDRKACAAYTEEASEKDRKRKKNWTNTIDLRRIRGFAYGPVSGSFAKLKAQNPGAKPVDPQLCLSIVLEKDPPAARTSLFSGPRSSVTSARRWSRSKLSRGSKDPPSSTTSLGASSSSHGLGALQPVSHNTNRDSLDLVFDSFPRLYYWLSCAQMMVKLRGYNTQCIVVPPGRVLWTRFLYHLREEVTFANPEEPCGPKEQASKFKHASFAQLILHRAIQVGIITGVVLSSPKY